MLLAALLRRLRTIRMISVAWWIGSLRILLRFSSTFAHRLAIEFNAIGIVDQPIHDAVRNAGITDLLVPVGNRQLTGQDCRTPLIAVISALEKVPSLVVYHRGHRKVVEQ